jgi:hypothetical protein
MIRSVILISLAFAVCAVPDAPDDVVLENMPEEKFYDQAAEQGNNDAARAAATNSGSIGDVLTQVEGLPTPDESGHLEIPDGTTSIPAQAYMDKHDRPHGTVNLAIKSVTIPPSVILIGLRAFAGCTNLATVTFSGNSSLKTIGEEAFYYTGLTSIAIPPSVTSIDKMAFAYSRNLAKVTFSAEHESEEESDKNETVSAKKKTAKKKNRQSSRSILKAVSREKEGTSSLKTIGVMAFSGCINLRAIAIPPSVTMIDAAAFYGCTHLRKVNFSRTLSLKTIGAEAFTATRLRWVAIPPSVTCALNILSISPYGHMHRCASNVGIDPIKEKRKSPVYVHGRYH